MILTTYLTSLPDPQNRRGTTIRPNDHNLVPLLPGAERNQVETIVFHDQLHQSFQIVWRGKFVDFIQVDGEPSVSLNDHRFFLFRDYLEARPYPTESVWISDLFDVTVNRDPHEAVPWESHTLFLGKQPWRFGDKSARGKSHARLMERWYGELDQRIVNQHILMAGTWGGSHASVLRFLRLLCTEIESLKPGLRNCNMAAFNKVAYCDIGRDFWWSEGPPLHSVLGARDVDNMDVAFVHK